MDNSFYIVNKPKTKKKSAQRSRSARDDAFFKLSQNLDKCLEECILKFYSPIVQKFQEVSAMESPDEIPSLFIQGHCVSWESVFRRIEQKWGANFHLYCLTSDDGSLKSLIKEAKIAKSQNKSLLIFVLHVECFARNSLIDNLIEFLINSEFPKYLVMNTAIDFSIILDRISRVNYTFLNVHTLELDAPSELLYNIYDKLLQGAVLGEVQFSGNILSRARARYLYENFSLGELRKYLTFALANFVIECDENVLASINIDDKKRQDSQNWTARDSYVNVLNGLLDLQSDLYGDMSGDSVENFLNFHHKLQNVDGFFANYFSNLRSKFAEWSKEKWISKLLKLEGHFKKAKVSEEDFLKLAELRDLLSEKEKLSQENTTIIEKIPKSPSRQNASTFLKNKSQMIQAARNLPSSSVFINIYNRLFELFAKYLVKLDERFIASIPRNKFVYLDTSNIPKLDEVMNRRMEVDSKHQLDVIALYHALIDSNSESLTTDVTQAFEMFSACLAESKIDEKCGALAPRFFNALGQLEYMGAVVVGVEETLRLVYLPTTMMNDKFDVEL